MRSRSSICGGRSTRCQASVACFIIIAVVLATFLYFRFRHHAPPLSAIHKRRVSMRGCDGNIEVYAQDFVVLHYAKHVHGDHFAVPCSGPLPWYRFIYQWGRPSPLQTWIQHLHAYQPSIAESNKAKHATDSVYVIQRIEAHNLYHTLCEWMNVFIVSQILKLNTSNVDIMFIDDRPYNSLESVWRTLFGNVYSHNATDKGIVHRRIVWNMIGYISPANNHDLPELPYIEEFQTFVLDAYGIKKRYHIDCKNVQVSIIYRRDYITHPERITKMKGLVQRKFRNELEILSSVKVAIPLSTVTTLVLEEMSMREQLSVMANTDILIGMHGAGLTHVLFVPDHAVLFELFPNHHSQEIYKHFRTFSKWRFLKYIMWQNDNDALEFDDLSTYVPPEVIIEKCRYIRRYLCS
ncbi:EGF domain-specific O-linked N-acetylglucosamine transferase-like [Dreissena polymorpha]|uniref:EGF domain-specific O-linked N-acetylglucosamine transferase n=1 Tax=Dreissena polymorpha TaxID=45954 RepID=A0A9D4J3D3_DREPO|nr:EGF domain-specific O-linked N-acetylglucosamine transferase-like [Dreissena polymorpha]KAH3794374.1 hypothetical protein DPMN_147907 [Dreissena polymorpha]